MENTVRQYPHKIREIEKDVADVVRKYFKGLRNSDFSCVGPKKYFFPDDGDLRKQMSDIYNMSLRPDDIFICTFARSGTTLTQELTWLIANNLDYATARSKNLIERYTVLGSYFINVKEQKRRMNDYKQRNCKHLNILERMVTSQVELFASAPSPRLVKSHLPLSLLPPNVLDVAKVIYVARNPRDVAVSLYHLYRQLKMFEFIAGFKTFWNFFIRGLVVRGPFFEQILEGWQQRHHPNMLFIFYEDLIKDQKSVIQRVCQFLNKKYTDEQIEGLCEHLKFETFKNNPSVNIDFLEEFNGIVPGEESFVRKGKNGGWRNYFDEEMNAQAQSWIDEHLRGTDLKFPQCS